MASVTNPIPLKNIMAVYKGTIKGCQRCKYMCEDSTSENCKNCMEIVIRRNEDNGK